MTRTGKQIFWIVVGAVLLLLLVGFAVGPTVVGRSMNKVVAATYPEVTPEVARLQATLDVADLHSDVLLWNRDILERGSYGHVDVPRLIEGRVALQAFTVVTKTPRKMNYDANTGDSDNITLLAVLEAWPIDTWSSLLERAIFQADKLRKAAERSNGTLTLIENRADLEAYLRRRAETPDITAGFLGLEGAHALEGEVDNVDRLYQAGFRMIGLTHFFDNEVGGSAHGVSKAGITPFGREVLRRMGELHMMVDLAHASPALIDDALALARGPVIVSHTGVKGTCDRTRNLSDGHLRAVAATGGVVGIGLWEEALCGETPADWARAVRHAADVAGVEHVALGSDWDGATTAIVDAAGTVHLTQALRDAGFTDGEIRAIMGGNVIRVLRTGLPPGEGAEAPDTM